MQISFSKGFESRIIPDELHYFQKIQARLFHKDGVQGSFAVTNYMDSIWPLIQYKIFIRL